MILTFIILDSAVLDSEPAFLKEGLESSGSESPSPSLENKIQVILVTSTLVLKINYTEIKLKSKPLICKFNLEKKLQNPNIQLFYI